GAPVLVELEPDRSAANLLQEPLRHRGVPLAGEPDVERQIVRGLEHAGDVPGARRAGSGVRPGRRTGAAADPGGDAARHGLERLLRRDEMDVRVHAARGHDQALRRDRLGRHAHGHAGCHARHHVGIAGLPDPGDAPVLDPDVRLDDAGPVDDERVGDDAVERLRLARARLLSHAVAQHLAPAELALVAVHGVVALHLRDQVRVAEPDPVTPRRAEQVGVVPPLDGPAHGFSSTCANPRETAAASARDLLAGSTGPSAIAFPPRATFAPASATSCTVLRSPGSKRTALPAGMSRRMPYALPRSNERARLVSKKW